MALDFMDGRLHGGNSAGCRARCYRGTGAGRGPRPCRGAITPVAKDGGGRSIDRRHRPRLQQHAFDSDQQPGSAQAAAGERRYQCRALRRQRARGCKPRRFADPPPARFLAPAAVEAGVDRAGAAGGGPRGNDHADARRNDQGRNRSRRGPMAHACRSTPTRKRHSESGGECTRCYA